MGVLDGVAYNIGSKPVTGPPRLDPAPAGGGSAPFDPGAWALGEYMKVYNDNGTYVPGTPGYTISHAAERDSARANYNQSEKDRAKVYGEAVSEVKGRNPGINAGYANATKDLRANARQRALEAVSADKSRDTDMLKAAAAMGLSVAPQVTGTRADQVAGDLGGQVTKNAEDWAGFNGGAAQRAMERNSAVADAFTWQGAQQQAALQQLLQETLSGLVDQYVAGTAGHMEGGTSTSQKLSALGKIMGYGQDTYDNALSSAKFWSPTVTTTTGPKGTTTSTREVMQ